MQEEKTEPYDDCLEEEQLTRKEDKRDNNLSFIKIKIHLLK